MFRDSKNTSVCLYPIFTLTTWTCSKFVNFRLFFSYWLKLSHNQIFFINWTEPSQSRLIALAWDWAAQPSLKQPTAINLRLSIYINQYTKKTHRYLKMSQRLSIGGLRFRGWRPSLCECHSNIPGTVLSFRYQTNILFTIIYNSPHFLFPTS